MSNLVPDPQDISIFQHEGRSILLFVVDEDGNPTSLQGRKDRLRFTVETKNRPPDAVMKVEDEAAFSIGGENWNEVTVDIGHEQSHVPAGEYRYRLWNVNTKRVLARGEFVVLDAAE